MGRDTEDAYACQTGLNRMKRQALVFFMWGYQEHFAEALERQTRQVLAELGLGKVTVRGSVVGVRSPGKTDPNAVCIAPEDRTGDLARFSALPSRVTEIDRTHPSQRMFYDDPASMADKPENIFRASVSQAVAELIRPDAAKSGFEAFFGLAAQVGNFHVVPVVEVDSTAISGDFVLDKPIHFNRWSAYPSLAHAAIDIVVEEGAEELLRKDPGRFFQIRGLSTNEIARRAGVNFMRTPAIALEDRHLGSGFFDRLNEISSLLYERKHGRGVIFLTNPDSPSVSFDLRFAQPVPLENARWSRKLLEMGNTDLALIADCRFVHGLGRPVARNTEDAPLVFEIEFLGQHRWLLKASGKPLIRCDFGVPRIPFRDVTPTSFMANFRRVFPMASEADAKCAAALYEEIERLDHGCMVVFSKDALSEALRLSGQGTPTVQMPMTADVLRRVSGIDGTVILDTSSVCHAVGVILDGPANENCDPARGSRYNSAVRYVRAEKTGRLAIVASDDGMINIIPTLRPMVSRRWLREQVEALETSTTENFYLVRLLLLEHRFYLGDEMCRRVNAALQRLASECSSAGRMSFVEHKLVPHPDLDESYFFEDNATIQPKEQK